VTPSENVAYAAFSISKLTAGSRRRPI